MFTGIIEDIGVVKAVSRQIIPQGTPEGGPEAGDADARRLTITARLLEEPIALGASLAVDGICLTIVAWSRGEASMVAGVETLERTTLGSLTVGAKVNLERALKLGDRLGGHMVAGHVDGVGQVAARADRGVAVDVTVAAPGALLRYVIEKGSIAVDGISLTVNHVDERGFTVSLIPHTQDWTTLPRKALGAAVNLEVDLIGKYVEKLVAPYAGVDTRASTLTLEKLKENGFA